MIGELNNQQIEQLLSNQMVGRIACCGEDSIYLFPMSYAYDGGYIYARGFNGLKFDIMRTSFFLSRRSLIARANLIHAVIACLSHPAAADETFVLRDGEDLSTAELVCRLRRALGRPARLLPVPPALLTSLAALLGRGDMARRLVGSLIVDDSKLRAAIDWRPPRCVDEALSEAATAFRSGRSR